MVRINNYIGFINDDGNEELKPKNDNSESIETETEDTQ